MEKQQLHKVLERLKTMGNNGTVSHPQEIKLTGNERTGKEGSGDGALALSSLAYQQEYSSNSGRYNN